MDKDTQLEHDKISLLYWRILTILFNVIVAYSVIPGQFLLHGQLSTSV